MPLAWFIVTKLAALSAAALCGSVSVCSYSVEVAVLSSSDSMSTQKVSIIISGSVESSSSSDIATSGGWAALICSGSMSYTDSSSDCSSWLLCSKDCDCLVLFVDCG